MDISSWTSLKQTVKINTTRKLFYGKFLYKAKIYAPAGKLILNEDPDKSLLLKKRIEHYRQYNWGGSWSHRQDEISTKADPKQLRYYHDARITFNNAIKLRVEEPHINLYCNDEQLLFYIVQADARLMALSRPSSEHAADLIRQGGIINHTITEYGYKIYIKDSKLNLETKQQILAYLESLGDQVRVIPSCTASLSRTFGFGGTYFYAKDPGIATMLQLISPDIISKICPLVNPDQ